jgi:hypothetical protein
VFVDTEEEFDWTKAAQPGMGRRSGESLPIMHKRLRATGEPSTCRPPIATTRAAWPTLREMQEAGECTIGTQLHPWVNPPFEEEK